MSNPGSAPIIHPPEEVNEWRRQVPDSKGDVYVLGGGDHEMDRIRKATARAGAEVVDLDLAWQDANVGGRAGEAIDEIIGQGKTAVTVELKGAGELRPDVVEVDHHNERSDRPASITQVLDRLGLTPVLADKLAAANDAGYFNGMDAVNEDILVKLDKRLTEAGIEEPVKSERIEASKRWLEMMALRVRKKDREAQGVTEKMEAEAEEAIKHAERDPTTGLVTVRINGDRPSPVTDGMHYTWEGGRENLVVVATSDREEKEVWFFGSGDQVLKVKEHFGQIRNENDKNGKTVGNEFFVTGGGAGLGKAGENAQCLVVARDSDDVIAFIKSIQAERQ